MHTHTLTPACVHLHAHTHTHASMHAFACTHTHSRQHSCICMHTDLRSSSVCVCTCMHAHTQSVANGACLLTLCSLDSQWGTAALIHCVWTCRIAANCCIGRTYARMYLSLFVRYITERIGAKYCVGRMYLSLFVRYITERIGTNCCVCSCCITQWQCLLVELVHPQITVSADNPLHCVGMFTVASAVYACT